MREIAWLIETTLGQTLYYSKTGFCSVASHGERYPTREAAEAVAKLMRTPTRVVEHAWEDYPR